MYKGLGFRAEGFKGFMALEPEGWGQGWRFRGSGVLRS